MSTVEARLQQKLTNLENRLRALEAKEGALVGTSLTEFLPQNYGAVGDGVTNDRDALNRVANTVIPAAGGEMIISRRYLIDDPADLTIPDYVVVHFRNNGRFIVGGVDATIVTIEGMVVAHYGQIIFDISGGGTVLLTKRTRLAWPRWWGAVGDVIVATGVGTDDTVAVLAAVNSGARTIALARQYKMTQQIVLPQWINLVGYLRCVRGVGFVFVGDGLGGYTDNWGLVVEKYWQTGDKGRHTIKELRFSCVNLNNPNFVMLGIHLLETSEFSRIYTLTVNSNIKGLLHMCVSGSVVDTINVGPYDGVNTINNWIVWIQNSTYQVYQAFNIRAPLWDVGGTGFQGSAYVEIDGDGPTVLDSWLMEHCPGNNIPAFHVNGWITFRGLTCLSTLADDGTSVAIHHEIAFTWQQRSPLLLELCKFGPHSAGGITPGTILVWEDEGGAQHVMTREYFGGYASGAVNINRMDLSDVGNLGARDGATNVCGYYQHLIGDMSAEDIADLDRPPWHTQNKLCTGDASAAAFELKILGRGDLNRYFGWFLISCRTSGGGNFRVTIHTIINENANWTILVPNNTTLQAQTANGLYGVVYTLDTIVAGPDVP